MEKVADHGTSVALAIYLICAWGVDGFSHPVPGAVGAAIILLIDKACKVIDYYIGKKDPALEKVLKDDSGTTSVSGKTE